MLPLHLWMLGSAMLRREIRAVLHDDCMTFASRACLQVPRCWGHQWDIAVHRAAARTVVSYAKDSINDALRVLTKLAQYWKCND